MTVKMAELFKKRPGMPLDEFHDYWLNQHSKVVMGLQGIERYVQNHPLPWSRDNIELPFDGIVEVWFESREVMRQNGESAYWVELVADEEKFIDRSDVTLLLAEEHVVKEGPTNPDGVKYIQPISWALAHAGTVLPEDWVEKSCLRIAVNPRVTKCVQNVLPSNAISLAAATPMTRCPSAGLISLATLKPRSVLENCRERWNHRPLLYRR